MNVRKIASAYLLLVIAAVPSVEARNHRHAHHGKPAVQTGKATTGDKASAEAGTSMDKRIKSICHGC